MHEEKAAIVLCQSNAFSDYDITLIGRNLSEVSQISHNATLETVKHSLFLGVTFFVQ